MSCLVTFHTGATEEKASIETIFPYGENIVVVTHRTPFHPRDYQWPDQPADRGVIKTEDGTVYPVIDAVVAGISADGKPYVDTEIPVKKSDPDWKFCVGHVIRGAKDLKTGDTVLLTADVNYRAALSRTHSATHVMALALDKSFARRWRKEAPAFDALGNPNFDQVAMDESHIGENACTDRYRMGKSLRKKGFTVEGLREELKSHEAEINETIAQWMQQDAKIVIEAEGNDLMARRFWTTKIEGQDVSVPCGGTHAGSLSEIGKISVTLEMPNDETLVITTYAK